MERGTEDLNSVGSDSRPSIDSFLYLCNVDISPTETGCPDWEANEGKLGGLIITPPAPRASHPH
ncbi:hypothetical protein N7497_002400 [Penicillium chrysogenum]|nr:hypothetical protein N7497_002400 [Penicillium chrysogenum]